MTGPVHADLDFAGDTSAAALQVFYDVQRRRSLTEKANDVFDLSDGLFALVQSGIRARHPELDDRAVFLRAAATRLPRHLMIRAYHWDPAEHE